jgi:hypothetical protein
MNEYSAMAALHFHIILAPPLNLCLSPIFGNNDIFLDVAVSYSMMQCNVNRLDRGRLRRSDGR